MVRTPHPSREWVARALLEIDQHGPLTELDRGGTASSNLLRSSKEFAANQTFGENEGRCGTALVPFLEEPPFHNRSN